MKVGIIVHSHTGNTLSVAERLKEALIKEGHNVTLERVMAVNEDPNKLDQIQLEKNPEISEYEVVIFGAPVWAFSLSRIMKYYLTNVSELAGKSIHCFVTQSLRFRFMGGNHAIRQMKQLCITKGGKVTKTEIVNWSSKNREQMITNLIKNLSELT